MRKISLLIAALLFVSGCDSTPTQAEIEKKAQAGDSNAQIDLYRLYNAGRARGGANHAEAMKWLNKSADSNNAEAQYMLGVIYSSAGYGEEKNDRVSADWYKKSVANGGKPALYQLAVSYRNGQGVDKDAVTAYAFLTLAQSYENKNAITQDEEFRSDLSADQIARARQLSLEIKKKYFAE